MAPHTSGLNGQEFSFQKKTAFLFALKEYVVQTNEFMRALELYFTAAFVQPVVLEQNM